MGWEVGDLALCVNDAPPMVFGRRTENRPEDGGFPLARGKIYCVARVGPVVDCCLQGISFDGAPLCPWLVARFRKITPGAKIEGVEERRRLPVKQDA